MTASLLKNDITQRQATKLWEQLRSHFVNAQKVIEEIIETQAWEPMGYASFSEAWTAQMSDITIATEIRPYVVYQMITEGASDEQVAAHVKGVGRDRAAALRRQRGNGVPAAHASLHVRAEDQSVVREHLRAKPSAPDTVHLKLGTVKLRRYQKIAKKRGMSVEDIALQAIEARFSELS